MSRLARSLALAVKNGFEAQAQDHARELYDRNVRAVAERLNHPETKFWLDTFDKQVHDRGARAIEAERAGDRKRAQELAQSALVAAENAAKIRRAVMGT